MNYQQALEYIHSVSWMGSKPGLERTRKLLSLMGNPQDKLRYIHVAGTNGKGSVCAMLASVLKSAGYKTGLYTSPYILRFNERMRINGVDIADEELAEITEYVKQFAETMEDHPTEFELVTAIGFEYFYRNGCDVVVLEVGMGGELDSTNIIKAPLVSVITELALDHTGVLGSTIAEIAKAKAGIIKQTRPVVSADNTTEGSAVISQTCKKLNSAHFAPPYDEIVNKKTTPNGISFTYNGQSYTVSLCGTYQFRNAAIVLKTLEVLATEGINATIQNIKEGLASVSWRARFEIMHRSPCFIYDGGHNPQGVSAAVESYKAHFGNQKAVVLIGVMADKDYTVELATLTEIAESFVTVRPDNPRSLSAEALSQAITAVGGISQAAESVADGVAMAIRLANGKNNVLATGSLYMYGEVKVAADALLKNK